MRAERAALGPDVTVDFCGPRRARNVFYLGRAGRGAARIRSYSRCPRLIASVGEVRDGVSCFKGSRLTSGSPADPQGVFPGCSPVRGGSQGAPPDAYSSVGPGSSDSDSFW